MVIKLCFCNPFRQHFFYEDNNDDDEASIEEEGYSKLLNRFRDADDETPNPKLDATFLHNLKALLLSHNVRIYRIQLYAVDLDFVISTHKAALRRCGLYGEAV